MQISVNLNRFWRKKENTNIKFIKIYKRLTKNAKTYFQNNLTVRKKKS